MTTEPCSCHDVEANTAEQRRVLRWVLTINLAQCIAGLIVGVWASSTALIGAALDNLADASVYAISLYAVGRSAFAKARVARLSGWLLILFAGSLLVEVVRRFFIGADPIGSAMMIMAAVNAGMNLVCLKLLAKHRTANVTFRATAIFTSNDTWANLGIVASGMLVWMTASPIPDLLIGIVVVYIAVQGGREILEQARDAKRDARAEVHS